MVMMMMMMLMMMMMMMMMAMLLLVLSSLLLLRMIVVTMPTMVMPNAVPMTITMALITATVACTPRPVLQTYECAATCYNCSSVTAFTE